MPKERLSNVKIKEVLRLKFDAALSNRQIGASLSISHSTVADYLHRAEEAGIGWPLPEELSESQLEQPVCRATAAVQQRHAPGGARLVGDPPADEAQGRDPDAVVAGV